MKQKIVIFGCGYVGGKLADKCIELGWDVTALTRNIGTAKILESKGVETITGQLQTQEWYTQINPEQDYIVDCVGAAEPSTEGYEHSYFLGMQSIIEWIEKYQVHCRSMLFTSSTSVYPQADGSLVDENSDHFGVSERGQILLNSEKLCLDVESSRVEKSFVLRFAGLYGPERHLLLNHVEEGKTIKGSGHRILNLLHQTDAVSSIMTCLQSSVVPSSSIFNVSDNQCASRMEIVEWMSNRLRLKNPGFDGMDRPGLPNRMIDSRKIQNELNWKPKYASFEQGYEDLLATR